MDYDELMQEMADLEYDMFILEQAGEDDSEEYQALSDELNFVIEQVRNFERAA